MFTGIVQGTGEVTSISDGGTVRRFSIEMSGLSDELGMGASVSVDGVCLTVSGMEGSVVDFDAIPETLERSTLGGLCVGDAVNLERALRMGAPGAYQVQAAVVTLHAQAAKAEQTDWRQIAELYQSLMVLSPSPVVELNKGSRGGDG